MSTQQIKRKDLKELYEMPNVCEGYKSKIKKYLQDDMFSDALSIDDNDIEAAFSEANQSQKKTLLKYFKPANRESVKTFKDVLKALSIAENSLRLIPSPVDDEEQSKNDYARLLTIAKFYNKGWKPNWKDSNEYKYYVYFLYFYYSGGCWSADVFGNCSDASRPSGVYFKSRESALDSYEKFQSTYDEYFMI